MDYLNMGTTPGLRPIPVPDPPPVPTLHCAYCGRVYNGVKPASCEGCGAPLTTAAKSAKEEYEEAYWRNTSLPQSVISVHEPELAPEWVVLAATLFGVAVAVGMIWLVVWR